MARFLDSEDTYGCNPLIANESGSTAPTQSRRIALTNVGYVRTQGAYEFIADADCCLGNDKSSVVGQNETHSTLNAYQGIYGWERV